MNRITPQKGFQTKFLSTSADIAIGGGSAGGGKTFAELMEAARYTTVDGFDAIIFRRTYNQIKTPGGLWDNSLQMYSAIGGTPNNTELYWKFNNGRSKIKMSNLEYENDVYQHQGGQYALIIFDELTHFTKKQFFYLLSRNRSTCGIKPYVRATTNPDPDSWVAEFIAWWIDQETGYAIPERAGVLRYMIAVEDNIVWGDTKQDIIDKMPADFWDKFPKDIDRNDLIKSVTFIPGSIYENKELLRRDPGYLANLMAQDEAERARLLDGNWKIRTDGMGIFDPIKVNDLFGNYANRTGKMYITCDAARFGRDLMVIMVWDGWVIVETIVATKSDEKLIVDAIERMRKKWGVPQSHTLIDQDGVGGGAVALGGYKGFSGGAAPMKDKETRVQENYKNLKTQCYYRMAERCNNGTFSIIMNSENVSVIEGSGKAYRGLDVMIGSKMYHIPELLKKQLRVIKKKDPDRDGKKQINDKEEQKLSLNGMSPDFADTIMMREWFEFKVTDFNFY